MFKVDKFGKSENEQCLLTVVCCLLTLKINFKTFNFKTTLNY